MHHSTNEARPAGAVTRRTVRALSAAVATGVVVFAGLSQGIVAHALVMTEVPVPLSPFGVATLGVNTYFTQADQSGTNNDSIGVLTNGAGPASTLATLAANSNPKVIVPGPDGALWFTEQGHTAAGNKIGRVTTGGTLTETTIPTAASGPVGITTGPDGNLWFTETDASKIASLQPCPTPGCTITEYPLGNSGAPLEITNGPAATNTVWYTERDISSIGYAVISGSTVTTHDLAIPTASSQPYGITLGGDHNIWFTEHSGNKVGRVNVNCVLTSGSNCITEFLVPTNSSAPAGIAQGPDGSLWFTEQRGNKVGHITTAGTFLGEFEIPTTGANPLNLISNGNRFWFTESATNKVGFFDVSSGTIGYVLDGWGALHPYTTNGATAPRPTGGPYWQGWDIARGVAIAPGTDSGYVLDGWGGVHGFSTQNSNASGGGQITSSFTQGWDIYRDIVVGPSGRSGYTLDGWGAIHPWSVAGTAMPPLVNNGPYWRGWDIAKRIVLNPADPLGESGWVLDGWGGMHTFSALGDTNTPNAIDATATGAYFSGQSIVRDVAMTANGSGYSLDSFGGVHRLGGAPNVFGSSRIWTFQIARGLVLTSDQTGAYVLDGFGAMHNIGTAPTVNTTSYWPGWDIARSARSVG